MFVHAIETAAEFTRPVHFISRSYGSALTMPDAATLFIVNNAGLALTCRHVAENLLAAADINRNFMDFKTRRANVPAGRKAKQWRREVERASAFRPGVTTHLLTMFVGCADTTEAEVRLHPTLDLALLRFNGFTRLLCTTFPIFGTAPDHPKQGKFLCRLGFPFAEFENYEYDAATDQIRWNATGRQETPRFPIEGMVTRHLADTTGIVGFEMSTPGLRGQSGGPAFDENGVVWGMQAATAHLDLNFDIDQDVIRNGLPKRVKESAFRHVGHCIHVNVLRDFMRSNNVAFEQA